MKFKFELQKILSYRTGLSSKAFANYQRQLGLVTQQLDYINALQNQILDTFQLNQGKIAEGGMSSSFLQINSELAIGLRKKVKLEQKKLQSLQVDLEDLREVLVKKKREQKSLELLRDRKRQAFNSQQKKKDQKAMDDLVVMRHAIKGDL